MVASCKKDNLINNDTASTKISFKINGVYYELTGEMTYNPLPVTGCRASYMPASNIQPSTLGIEYVENTNQVFGISIINASTSSGNYPLTYQSQYYGDFYIFRGGGPYILADTQTHGPNALQINYTITNNRLNGTFSGTIKDFNFISFDLTEGKIQHVPVIQ